MIFITPFVLLILFMGSLLWITVSKRIKKRSPNARQLAAALFNNIQQIKKDLENKEDYVSFVKESHLHLISQFRDYLLQKMRFKGNSSTSLTFSEIQQLVENSPNLLPAFKNALLEDLNYFQSSQYASVELFSSINVFKEFLERLSKTVANIEKDYK